MTEENPTERDLVEYEDWDEIQYVANLLNKTLQENHEQFGGKHKFSNASAIAACYSLINYLSSNAVNHFGVDSVDSMIDKLNVFQVAIIQDLEKFRHR